MRPLPHVSQRVNVPPGQGESLFQEQGLTVAAWIRERRLERCRHDLADPRLLARPVQGVATRDLGLLQQEHAREQSDKDAVL
ncbi:hypothetical protein GCM10010187_32420 [Actinomadura coerulea]|nr:hypothetical protein GCM10010187_32420 [Actinomadura coerulea]